MAHKINHKQAQLHLLRSAIDKAEKADTSSAAKELAIALASSINLQPYQREIIPILGYTGCRSNRDAIVRWFQTLQNDIHSLDFITLRNKLINALNDVDNPFSSI